MLETELYEAVGKGDLEAIRSLLDAGANVRYVRPHNYSVMIDVMHGRSIAADAQLLQVLRLLIERGADLDRISDYGESALSVSSNMGRFDAVGLLLEAGANPAPLGWNPLMRAVVLGTVEDVRSRIEAGADLTAKDGWERTAWLLSLQTGDIAKAEALLEAGANLADRGRCGKTALVYPIGNGHVAMLKWLLAHEVDPDATDDYGGSALIHASECGATESVKALLEAGADLHHSSNFESAIKVASNLATVRALVDAGADLNDINGDMRAALAGLPHDESVSCTQAEFRAARTRVFGSKNPERMNFPFWKAMVSGGANAYRARSQFEPDGRSGSGPVWCFERFGKSINELSDGRIIEIAGEHEDYYDEDFCIYNDVIVHRGDGNFDIYGYPETVFPPTDFHSATLAGTFLYIIGSVGYQGERRFGTTPVYRLDINTLVIESVETFGISPGWISRHKAKLVDDRIEVSGGNICRFVSDEELYDDNPKLYALDLKTRVWSIVMESSKPG